MGELNLQRMATWIPSGVGEFDGWVIRRKIYVGPVLGIIYDVEDDWYPRNVGKRLFRRNFGHLDIDWDRKPLGKVPDQQIANELGVSHTTVVKARLKRSIPGTRPRRVKLDIDWNVHPFGKRFDAEIARDLGVSPKTVARERKKRKISRKYVDWDNQPLGEVTDAQLARKLGMDSSTVWNARRVRGIKPKKPKCSIDWSKEPLGKISDSDIARGVGVSQTQVSRARRKLGIHVFVDGKCDTR